MAIRIFLLFLLACFGWATWLAVNKKVKAELDLSQATAISDADAVDGILDWHPECAAEGAVFLELPVGRMPRESGDFYASRQTNLTIAIDTQHTACALRILEEIPLEDLHPGDKNESADYLWLAAKHGDQQVFVALLNRGLMPLDAAACHDRPGDHRRAQSLSGKTSSPTLLRRPGAIPSPTLLCFMLLLLILSSRNSWVERNADDGFGVRRATQSISQSWMNLRTTLLRTMTLELNCKPPS